MTEVCSAGFPHSDIHGSLPVCGSPWLFAAYHVFLRLSVPRHPPCALSSLTILWLAIRLSTITFRRLAWRLPVVYSFFSDVWLITFLLLSNIIMCSCQGTMFWLFHQSLHKSKRFGLSNHRWSDSLTSPYNRKAFLLIFRLIWQPPTLPSRLQLSTIGRLSLNHRVRDVDGCFP